MIAVVMHCARQAHGAAMTPLACVCLAGMMLSWARRYGGLDFGIFQADGCCVFGLLSFCVALAEKLSCVCSPKMFTVISRLSGLRLFALLCRAGRRRYPGW